MKVIKTKEYKISNETAFAQVDALFEAFELDIADSKHDAHSVKLIEYVQRGRLEISGTGDEVTIKQMLRGTCAGQKELVWNWSRLGLGKSRVKINADGIMPFGQSYIIAAPMLGVETSDIMKMHPVDVSAVEDIASFFRTI